LFGFVINVWQAIQVAVHLGMFSRHNWGVVFWRHNLWRRHNRGGRVCMAYIQADPKVEGILEKDAWDDYNPKVQTGREF
jgi:hypothetical protein